VKQATDTLCDADAGGLPALSTANADERWTRIYETHLFKQDINPGPIDGDFDARTLTATKALQRALGVADTGRVGEATWTALWTDQCYVAPAPAADTSSTWQPSTGGSSGGGSSSGGGGGGGTLDRVE
jgi:peptidoglycan hydrolase-like protein with peptidoglycan-binding domain